MNPQKLAEILASHSLWVSSGEVLGERANLGGANLKGADLRGASLQGAFLRDADLRGAGLRDANLLGANLQGANLKGAILESADIRSANLRDANLSDANLSDANLRDASLRDASLLGTDLLGADLRGANLRGAILDGANLRGAILDGANLDGAIFTENWLIVPPVGQSFTAFKKVAKGVVLELLIPGSAQRTSSLIGRKCRANEALVVGVVRGAANNAGIYRSLHDPNFTYEVGKMAREPAFNPDIRVECTTGIHFFMTKEEAINYKF